jgi:hypothetical protein
MTCARLLTDTIPLCTLATMTDTDSDSDSDSDSPADCCICREAMHGGGRATLACRHTFHKACIAQWFGELAQHSEQLLCPLCRRNTPQPAMLATIAQHYTNINRNIQLRRWATCVLAAINVCCLFVNLSVMVRVQDQAGHQPWWSGWGNAAFLLCAPCLSMLWRLINIEMRQAMDHTFDSGIVVSSTPCHCVDTISVTFAWTLLHMGGMLAIAFWSGVWLARRLGLQTLSLGNLVAALACFSATAIALQITTSELLDKKALKWHAVLSVPRAAFVQLVVAEMHHD